MADPYRRARGELKAAIVGRVGAGEPLSAIEREPGMPSSATIRNWRKADAAFAEEMAGALARGAWRRRWMFDPVRAEAFLARYRTGEPIHVILRDPAMPSRPVLDYWRATNGEFGEAVHLQKVGHEPHRLRGLKRAKTPRPFDQAVADRIVLRVHRGEPLKTVAADPEMPGLMLIRRWRGEQPEFDAALKTAIGICRRQHGRAQKNRQALGEAIAAKIIEGHSLHSLSRTPGMPSAETLYRWVRERPDFADLVAEACKHRDDAYADRILEIAQTVGPGRVTETRKLMSPLRRRLAWVSSGSRRLRERRGI